MSRIPATLQAVILTSNRGKDVNAPPPQRVAFRTFFRGMIGSSSKNVKNAKKPALTTESSKRQVITKQASQSTLTTKKKKKTNTTPSLRPQQYLDAMVRSRGYSVVTFATLQSAYYNKPTPLQEASYGVYLLGLVKNGNADGLRAALAAGLSKNPCNKYGESLLHMICRRGDSTLLAVMLEEGCDIQVADDYGRTPLHDACWAVKPAFAVVEMLLERDASLFYLTDSRGALPLSYVPKEHWSQWLQFLESKKDVYWPRGGSEELAPSLTLQKPNTRPPPQPKEALTVELARMVAMGRMEPAEALFLNYELPEEDDTEEDSEGSEYDSDDYSDCSESDSDDDNSAFNEDEMNEILASLALRNKQSLIACS